MAYMCVLSHSLYNAKECDDCGKCEERYDYDREDYEYDRWRDREIEAYEKSLEEE